MEFSMEHLLVKKDKKEDDSFSTVEKMSNLLIVIVTMKYERHENRKLVSCLYNINDEWEMKMACITVELFLMSD